MTKEQAYLKLLQTCKPFDLRTAFNAGTEYADLSLLAVLLQHLPDALAEVKTLPDIENYWLDPVYNMESEQ